MASMSMAEHFANTDINEDLPHGEFDVKVKRTMVKPGKVEGDSRVLVTWEALSGAGTVLEGQGYMPSNPKTLFHWFNFITKMGFTKEFMQNNPDVTSHDIASYIDAAKDTDTYRIRIEPQANNPQYNRVTILGAATGEADVLSAQESAPSPVQAESPEAIPPPAPKSW